MDRIVNIMATVFGTLWLVGVFLFTTDNLIQMAVSIALIFVNSAAMLWLSNRWDFSKEEV